MDLYSTIQSKLFDYNSNIAFDYMYLRDFENFDLTFNNPDLHLAELEYCKAVARKRQIEFTASRILARRLLKQFKIEYFPLLPLENRMPNWPEEITGSIAHSSELCMVAIASKKVISSIGIDIESRKRLHPKLWPACLTHNEIEFVCTKPLQEQLSWATLIFSAKESFFKFQYPITHHWLGFKEAEIIRFPETLNDNTYTLKLNKDLTPPFMSESLFEGRFLLDKTLVMTAFLPQ